ncbi:MAG: hypothetical protein ACOC5G_02245 [Acidobacteriota bacterium]
MRKVTVFVFLVCLVFTFLFSDKYDLLNMGVNIKPKRLSRGQEGNIEFKFTVKQGIAISSQPSFIIEVEPSETLAFSKDFFTASDLDIKVEEKEGKKYLDFSDPVRVPFAVKPEAERGNHIIKGKVKYFACSLEDGWCLKDKKEFSATFYTARRDLD